jgi:hypothetical protein
VFSSGLERITIPQLRAVIETMPPFLLDPRILAQAKAKSKSQPPYALTLIPFSQPMLAVNDSPPSPPESSFRKEEGEVVEDCLPRDAAKVQGKYPLLEMVLGRKF